jgi:hypothetical protein
MIADLDTLLTALYVELTVLPVLEGGVTSIRNPESAPPDSGCGEESKWLQKLHPTTHPQSQYRGTGERLSSPDFEGTGPSVRLSGRST